MIFQIVSFGLIGILAGVLSGLLGISGGVVTIPCLLLVFSQLGIAPTEIMHLAIGTSLAAMVFNTLSASFAHHKKKGVLFSIVKPMTLGIILGAILGATIARFLSGHFLQIFFGVFEILLGLRYFLPEKKVKQDHKLPSFWPLSGISTATATLSTILGIGGGIINVPILTHFHVPVKKAIGTSSVLSFLVSLFGASSYLFLGIKTTKTAYAVGYLYVPAFIIISIVAVCLAPVGVHLAHLLPTKILRRVFGIVLFIAGFIMVLKR